MYHNAISQDLGGARLKGRRGRSRLRTCLPGRLVTLGANHRMILLDISLTGAQFLLRQTGIFQDQLEVPSDAVLEWEAGEAFGQVMRGKSNLYGMVFHDMATPQMLIATRDLHDQLARRGGLAHLEREMARHFVEGGK